MTSPRRANSVDCLKRIYQRTCDIRQCREGMLFMAAKQQAPGYMINQTDSGNMEKIRIRTIRLRLLQQDEMLEKYSNHIVKRENRQRIPDYPESVMRAQTAHHSSERH